MGMSGAAKWCWLISSLAAIAVCAWLIQPEGRSGDGRPRPAVEAAVPTEAEILRALEKAADTSPFFKGISYAFALAIFIGMAVDAEFLWRRLVRRRPIAGRLTGRQDWGMWDVFLVAVVFWAAFLALIALSPLLFGAGEEPSQVSRAVIFQFAAEAAAVAFLFMIVPGGAVEALGKLGFFRGNTVRRVLAGIKGYMGFLPILLLLTWVTELGADRLGIELQPQEQIGFFFADLSLPALCFLVLFVVFLGPIFEEIFFRGFAYQAMRRFLGLWPSILVSAGLFSALHASASVFLPIMGLGVVLAYSFESSGSLVTPVTIHICQNGIAVAGALLIRSLS